MGLSLGSLFGGSSILGLGISAMTGGLGGIGMQLAKMAISQIAQNVARQLGLPPMVTEMLVGAIEKQLGPGLPGDPQTSEGVADFLSDVLGIDLDAAQEAVSSMEELMQEIMDGFTEDETKNGAERNGGTSGGKGPRSWIMAMAEKLGEIVDEQFEQMNAQMDKVMGLQAASKKKNFFGKPSSGAENAKADLPGETIKMQAEVQQFNMLMQGANNALKTAGQAAGTMAGRQ